jgi:glucosamine-6-phosphate deaminase
MIRVETIGAASGKAVTTVLVDSPTEMGWAAARIIKEDLGKCTGRPFVLGLPTGATPVPLYDALLSMYMEREISFGNVVTFNLDEYMDIPPYHPNSFRAFMDLHLFRYVDLALDRIHFLNGLTKDWRATCSAYERAIREAGGIDIQVLGIGVNGHIAFNEPGTEPDSRTRLVRLSEHTLRENAKVFADPKEAPEFALTMGIGTILEARKVLLLATGAKKANAVYESLMEPAAPRVPASFLQTMEGECVYILDVEAAAELPFSL